MNTYSISAMKLKNGLANPQEKAYSLLRRQCVEWLRELDIQYHLTLTFPYGEQVGPCVDHANDLFHRLNLKIFKQRYSIRREGFIRGVVVMEDTPAKDTIHFHILILKQEYMPDTERFQSLIEKTIVSINRVGKRKIDKFQLDEYYLQKGSGIEGYVTKQFEKTANDQIALERLAVLADGGMVYGKQDISIYGQIGTQMPWRYTAC